MGNPTPEEKIVMEHEAKEHLEKMRQSGAFDRQRETRIVVEQVAADAQPNAGEKIVHFIRHGQGYHNLLGLLYRRHGITFSATGEDAKNPEKNPYMIPEAVDPPLTQKGRMEARALRPGPAVELVVCSPLRRAVETAVQVYGAIPMVAHELTRELKMGHVCDSRRPRADIELDFPQLDVSSLEEEDPIGLETHADAADRAYQFLMWLRDRQEARVTIASSSAWLFTLLNAVVVCDNPESAQWYHTGELRSFRLRYEDAK